MPRYHLPRLIRSHRLGFWIQDGSILCTYTSPNYIWDHSIRRFGYRNSLQYILMIILRESIHHADLLRHFDIRSDSWLPFNSTFTSHCSQYIKSFLWTWALFIYSPNFVWTKRQLSLELPPLLSLLLGSFIEKSLCWAHLCVFSIFMGTIIKSLAEYRFFDSFYFFVDCGGVDWWKRRVLMSWADLMSGSIDEAEWKAEGLTYRFGIIYICRYRPGSDRIGKMDNATHSWIWMTLGWTGLGWWGGEWEERERLSLG